MCETKEEVADLLRDIGTLSELQAWSERFEVAKQLSQGLTYREIAANTGASTTTVTRVAKYLENGEGGYRNVLKTHRHHRLHTKTDEQNTESRERSDSVLKKYLHK